MNTETDWKQRAEKLFIPLNESQEQVVKQWAEDDRLWTTRETVTFNLRVFARCILSADQRAEKAEAACAEMREAIQRLYAFAAAYTSHPLRNTDDNLYEVLALANRALSTSCGTNHIHVRELDKTIEVLRRASNIWSTTDIASEIYIVETELTRLEALRKESK
jgi:hypothetical protein